MLSQIWSKWRSSLPSPPPPTKRNRHPVTNEAAAASSVAASQLLLFSSHCGTLGTSGPPTQIQVEVSEDNPHYSAQFWYNWTSDYRTGPVHIYQSYSSTRLSTIHQMSENNLTTKTYFTFQSNRSKRNPLEVWSGGRQRGRSMGSSVDRWQEIKGQRPLSSTRWASLVLHSLDRDHDQGLRLTIPFHDLPSYWSSSFLQDENPHFSYSESLFQMSLATLTLTFLSQNICGLLLILGQYSSAKELIFWIKKYTENICHRKSTIIVKNLIIKNGSQIKALMLLQVLITYHIISENIIMLL